MATEPITQEPIHKDILDYLKGIYAFLESTSPAGFAEEVFRLPASSTQNQRSLQDAIQSNSRGQLSPTPRQDTESGEGRGRHVVVKAVQPVAPQPEKAEPVAQEPVAWRVTRNLASDPYSRLPVVMQTEPLEVQPGTSVEPLYTTPPDLAAEVERLREELEQETGEGIDNDKRWQAKVATLEAALREAKEKLGKLARLGNGEQLGNSIGNVIAQEALATIDKVLGDNAAGKADGGLPTVAP